MATIMCPHCMRVFDPKPRGKPKAKGKRAAPAYTDEFLQSVWVPYPRKAGTSKLKAFQKWSALPEQDRAAVVATIPAYVRMMRGKEEQFICHLEFFISRRLFETVEEVRGANGSPLPLAKPQTESEWVKVVRLYSVTNNWRQEYGPPPGHNGCLVPAELLRGASEH